MIATIDHLVLAAVEVPISVSETVDGTTYTYAPSSIGLLLGFLLGFAAILFAIVVAVREGYQGRTLIVIGVSVLTGVSILIGCLVNLGNYAIVTPDYIEFTKSRRSRRIERADLHSVEYYETRGRRGSRIQHVVFKLRDGQELDYSDEFLITASHRARELFSNNSNAVAAAPVDTAMPQADPAAEAASSPAPPPPAAAAAQTPMPTPLADRIDPEMGLDAARKRHEEVLKKFEERRQARLAELSAVGEPSRPEPSTLANETRPSPLAAPSRMPSVARQPEASGRSIDLPKSAKQAKRGTKLAVGMPIVAEWGASYYHATIVSLESNGHVKVHYDGWPDSADEVIPRDKVYYDPSQLSANAAVSDRATPGDGIVRTWKDSTGKHTIEAELIGNEKGVLKLKRKDGKVISIPIEKLSEADQDRVK